MIVMNVYEETREDLREIKRLMDKESAPIKTSMKDIIAMLAKQKRKEMESNS